MKNFRQSLGDDPEVPNLSIRNFGYLYLSDNEAFTKVLQRDQQTQARLGAGTQMITRGEIAEAYPFFRLDDIVAGSLNQVDEGYFDAPAMLRWQQRKAQEKGVEYIQDEVVSMNHSATKIDKVTLKSGFTRNEDTLTSGKLSNLSLYIRRESS